MCKLCLELVYNYHYHYQGVSAAQVSFEIELFDHLTVPTND